MSGSTVSRPAIRVLVAEATGSAPREAGAAMTVTADGFDGTIGGGALEFEAIAAARSMLAAGAAPWSRRLETRALGPDLGQCCGGRVRLLFVAEGARTPVPTGARLAVHALDASGPPQFLRDRAQTAGLPAPVARAASAMLSGERPEAVLWIDAAGGWVIEPAAQPAAPVYLYGAGHVGRAFVRATADLPLALRWIDTARDRFPETIADHAAMAVADDPAGLAAAAPADAIHLVMTYSHALDLAICRAVLARGDFRALGLIGSATKRARFRSRLSASGVPPAMLDRMTCPIGVEGVSGKAPPVIAIAVAAQALQWVEAADSAVASCERRRA